MRISTRSTTVRRSLVLCCLSAAVLAGFACTGAKENTAGEAPAVQEVPATTPANEPVTVNPVNATADGAATGFLEAYGIPVEAEPPAAPPGIINTKPAGTGPTLAEYSAQADAICKAAEDRLEAALPELYPLDRMAFDQLAFDISGQALAELRALPPPEVPAVNPVALCSHRGGTHESIDRLTRAEYIAQANTICSAAGGRLHAEVGWGGTELEDWAAFDEAAARIEEEALAELRALRPPEADRALLEEAFYSVVEQEIDVLRETAAAAAAGDIARAFFLGEERVHLTHQRDGFLIEYGLGWCPVPLSA